jgi:hypothetical protein
MPNLYDSIGNNSRKVKPNSMFIPKLTPVMVWNNTNDWIEESDQDNYSPTGEYQASNSKIFRAVQAIQQYCEVYEISNSSYSDRFTVICRDSSIPYNTGDDFTSVGDTITILTAALTAVFPGEDVYAAIGELTDDDTDG